MQYLRYWGHSALDAVPRRTRLPVADTLVRIMVIATVTVTATVSGGCAQPVSFVSSRPDNLQSPGISSEPKQADSATSKITALTVQAAQAVDSIAAIKQTGEWRNAERCFANGDRVGARQAIERLLDAPGNTPEVIHFLLDQRAFCLRPSQRDRSPIVRLQSRPQLALNDADCGPRALLLVCRLRGIDTNLTTLRKVAGTDERGTNVAGLIKAARSVGFRAEGVQMDLPALARLQHPALVWMDGNHFVALLSVDGDRQRALIHDPNRKEVERVPLRTLLERSGGILVTLQNTTN